MLVQRQTPSVQVFNRVGSGMISFQYIFLSTNIICPIVVSYFPVSVLASMHACAENDPAETTHDRKPMLNECATCFFSYCDGVPRSLRTKHT